MRKGTTRTRSEDCPIKGEVWKPITRAGYESLYEISDYGRCRSSHARHGCFGHQLIRAEPVKTGYLRFTLQYTVGGVRHKKYIFAHVAVAEAFLPPRPPKHRVAHADGSRTNNHISNLSWKTQIDNLADRYLHGTHYRGELNPQAKLNQYAVALIRAAWSQQPVTKRLISLAFGVSDSQLARILKGESWTGSQPTTSIPPKGGSGAGSH